MKSLTLALSLLCTGLVSAAHAQTSAPGDLPARYAELTGGLTFGHNTSGQFGVEVGVPYKNMRFFAEGGRMQNVTTSNLTDAAAVITQALTAPGSAASSTAKQPVNYFAVGTRFAMPTGGRYEPFVLVGVGAAKVTKNVSFAVNGTDITNDLLSHGIQLGRDLAGSESRALLEIGIGTRVALTGRLFGELSYRYAHIFLLEPGMNTNRLQVGVGAGF